jgi:hypothetical protein
MQHNGLAERIAALEYDAANDEWTRTDYYYNASWQVIEERRVTGVADYEDIDDEPATAVYCQYVWDAQYIDTPVCRMRDANGFATGGGTNQDASGDGTLEETMYYLTDANHNVTALLDGSRDGSGAFGPPSAARPAGPDNETGKLRKRRASDDGASVCGGRRGCVVCSVQSGGACGRPRAGHDRSRRRRANVLRGAL